MPYWKAIRSQAVDIAAYVLKVYEEEEMYAVLTAHLSREREREREHIYQQEQYYINITFPARVKVENIIPRNVIINRGAAEVDNHISRDDIFDYHQSRKCNIYFIIPNRTLDPLFSEEPLLLNIPIMVRGDPKGK